MQHITCSSPNRDNLLEYHTGAPRLFGVREVAWGRFEEEARPVRDRLRFEVPLYAVSEAARIVDVPVQTLSRWTRGSAAVTWKPPAGRGCPSIPFVGLAEALVLAALRRSGVPMQRIRPALQDLEAELGLEHALASQRLYTDEAELLFDYADAHISGELLSSLVVVRSGQRVFAEAVKAYLDRITYGEDGYPTLIRVPAYRQAEVVVDPSMSFGSPIFRAGGTRVEDVMDRFWAGESLADVSAEFGVPLDQLEDVVRVASSRAA